MKDIILRNYLEEKEGIQVKEIKNEYNNYYIVITEDGEERKYLVLTEDEKNKELEKRINDLIDNEVIDSKSAITRISKTGYGVRLEMFIDFDDDDVSNILAPYDGIENNYEYMEKIYYIYRQN